MASNVSRIMVCTMKSTVCLSSGTGTQQGCRADVAGKKNAVRALEAGEGRSAAARPRRGSPCGQTGEPSVARKAPLSFLMHPRAHVVGMRPHKLPHMHMRHPAPNIEAWQGGRFGDKSCARTGFEHFSGADGHARREGGPQITGQRLQSGAHRSQPALCNQH